MDSNHYIFGLLAIAMLTNNGNSLEQRQIHHLQAMLEILFQLIPRLTMVAVMVVILRPMLLTVIPTFHHGELVVARQ